MKTTHSTATPFEKAQALPGGAKQAYVKPELRLYGDLRDITRGTGSKVGGDAKSMMTTSDRRCKQDISLLGQHPLGVGLYLYRYRPEMQARYGSGVYFGVMADELEQVLPEAVSVGSHGYRQVDYAQLVPPLSLGMLQA